MEPIRTPTLARQFEVRRYYRRSQRAATAYLLGNLALTIGLILAAWASL